MSTNGIPDLLGSDGIEHVYELPDTGTYLCVREITELTGASKSTITRAKDLQQIPPGSCLWVHKYRERVRHPRLFINKQAVEIWDSTRRGPHGIDAPKPRRKVKAVPGHPAREYKHIEPPKPIPSHFIPEEAVKEEAKKDASADELRNLKADHAKTKISKEALQVKKLEIEVLTKSNQLIGLNEVKSLLESVAIGVEAALKSMVNELYSLVAMEKDPDVCRQILLRHVGTIQQEARKALGEGVKSL